MIQRWIQRVAAALERGADVFVAIVADNSPHSPGTRGAGMWITTDGEIGGTIGGGAMELRVSSAATDWLASPPEPRFELHRLHHRRDGEGERSGMQCSGWQTNLYGVLRARSDLADLVAARDLVASRRAGTLEIAGDRLRVCADDPDTSSEPIALTRDANTWTLRVQLLNHLRAAILGGGHCGLALGRLLTGLGYDVTVFDVRSRAPVVGHEDAGRVVVIDDYAEAGARIAHPELTHAIVMTSDMPSDVRALIGLADAPFPYVGVMGSRTKGARIVAALRAAGIDDAYVARVRTRVGLPMVSNTPEEIAVSVAAELLTERLQLVAAS